MAMGPGIGSIGLTNAGNIRRPSVDSLRINSNQPSIRIPKPDEVNNIELFPTFSVDSLDCCFMPFKLTLDIVGIVPLSKIRTVQEPVALVQLVEAESKR